MQPKTSDEAWAAFCAGDASAFDAIMLEHQQGLMHFLQGYVHSPETAEDLAEDTFVELLLHKERFRGQSSLKTYLFAVARHKAIDYLRRQKRRPTVALDDLGEQQDVSASPEEALQTQENARKLTEAIEGLHADYKEALRLFYVEQLHYDEIMVVMHKNQKQVENLIYRARVALRKTLRKEADWFEEL